MRNGYFRNAFLATVALAAAGPIGTATASPLSDAAASLQPGQWTEFSTQGWSGSLLDACDGIHSIFEYAQKGIWNPIKKEIHFVGQGHYACGKYIVYSEATNQWHSNSAIPNGIASIGHSYEHLTGDPRNGDLYYRNFNSTLIEKYNPASNSWSGLPRVDTDSHQVAGAIAFFPEANGILYVDGDWGVHFWSRSSNSWSHVANTAVVTDASKPQLAMSSLSNFASYNPVHRVIYFGSGNTTRNVYSIDAQKNIRTLANAPVPISPKSAMSLADPSTGTQLLFADNGSMYAYDREQDEWQSAGSHPVMDHATDWRISVPIPEFGVIMFLTWNFSDSKILLYRYAPGSTAGPVVSPSAPVQLKAN